LCEAGSIARERRRIEVFLRLLDAACVARVGRPRHTTAGWQLWYVFGGLDCLSYVAVLQTKDAQVDARPSQAP
jgi:hypothetical protein